MRRGLAFAFPPHPDQHRPKHRSSSQELMSVETNFSNRTGRPAGGWAGGAITPALPPYPLTSSWSSRLQCWLTW